MEKKLVVTVPGLKGEEGLNIACREGKLFRNDATLDIWYKKGFRIYNYSIESTADNADEIMNNRVTVFLKK